MSVDARAPVQIQVPEDAFAGDRPLVAVMRGEHVGSLHRGTVSAAGAGGGEVLAIGDTEQRIYLRSGAKPFQVMPAILARAVERFHLSDRELAVLCASHHGEQYHTETILDILHRAGLKESALHCGVHPPLDAMTAAKRLKEGRDPTPVCNNCSGSHTGMLLACLARGWPLETYGSPDHPLQKQTRGVLASFAGLEPDRIDLAVDNCAVPTFRLPLRNAARAFARLGTGDGLSDELRQVSARVRRAMSAFPEMVGGRVSFDTDLMRAGRGAIVSKGGAEGFQGAAFCGLELGFAIKITDGNSRAIPPTVMEVAQHMGALDREQLRELETWREPSVENHRGETVGRLVAVFALEGAT